MNHLTLVHKNGLPISINFYVELYDFCKYNKLEFLTRLSDNETYFILHNNGKLEKYLSIQDVYDRFEREHLNIIERQRSSKRWKKFLDWIR